MTPSRFENGSPMLLAGLRRRHTLAAAERGVAEQWREFLAGPEIAGRVGAFFYGVICGGDADGFEYLCGVEVESFDGLAPGTGRMRVPTQRYAVFAHPSDASTGSTWRRIFAWLDEGPYASAHKPDFERYPSAPHPAAKPSGVEIWVGVVEKRAAAPGT